MATGGNIMGGIHSPGFKEYEMLKTAEKTGVFHEKEEESAYERRKGRKEWAIVFTVVVVIAVIVAVVFRVL